MIIMQCHLCYLAISHDTDDVVEHIGTVAASAEIKYVLPTTGIKLGKHFIVVSLASDKIDHVTGEHEVRIIDDVKNSLHVHVNRFMTYAGIISFAVEKSLVWVLDMDVSSF